MATWTEAEKAHALDLLREGTTLAEVHRSTGIPKPTLLRWAKAEGVTVARSSEKTRQATAAKIEQWAERRAIVAEKAGRLAEQAIDEAASLLAAGEYLEAQRVMTVVGVSADKAQLLTGQATSRHEHSVPDRTPEQEGELAQVLELVKGAA